MKQFELDGLQYECEDKYNFFARDKNEEVWVYEDEPEISELTDELSVWDSYVGEEMQVHPVVTNKVSWTKSKGEIK